MKKSISGIIFSIVLAVSCIIPVVAQEQPKPEKDTINMDTEAKPEFYYAVEDKKTEDAKGSGKIGAGAIVLIAGAVIIIGGAAFFLLKKKK
ncbi:MAG: hypothetical protein MUC93_11090 [Bacteroidales bacterium]|jgi:hypothetical protein|nr:hypothetical protein [Bacteroidales bacterium]